VSVPADDIAHARSAARSGKQIGGRVRALSSGCMAPRAPTWDVAADLASSALDLAYHVTWLANEVELQEARIADLKAEIRRRDLAGPAFARLAGQVRALGDGPAE
jgi:hypothetical protein